MRLTRLPYAAPLFAALALMPAAAVRSDDTSDFLNPANWEGRTDLWKVENGSIVGETKEDPKYNTFLCSKRKYADFEMSFKIQLRDGAGNSGVQIRSEVFDKEKFRVKGPQADVGQQFWGSLYGENFGGMMKASPADKVKSVVKPTEFNDYSIRAVGKKVTIKINGETMVDGEFPKMPDDGIIAFQIHAGYPKMRVEFKDIKFRELKK